jgi:YidC/Oxa1 family membrane protein insertase
MLYQRIHPDKGKIEPVLPSKENFTNKKEEKINKKGIDIISNLKKSKPTNRSEIIAVIETPLYKAEITSYNASLKSWKLKNYRESLEANSQNIEMVNISQDFIEPLFLDLFSITGVGSTSFSFNSDKKYIALIHPGESKTLTCESTIHNGIKINKIYTFYADKYLIDLIVKVQNLTEKTIKGRVRLLWTYQLNIGGKNESRNDHHGPIALIHNKREEIKIEKIEKNKMFTGEVAWAGFEDKYFIAAMVPRLPNMFFWQIEKGSDIISSELISKDIEITSGNEKEIPFSVYIGPKEIDSLKSSGLHLDKALHFGWFDFLAKPLLYALKFFNKYISNYGVSIIVLTIIVKILFWPLATKSYKSMKELQRIQPRILQIRERFKNNKEELNRELMQLYRTHKVNPMGGCIPMLLQIPVFFALYYTLLGAIELRHAPFIFWIKDLSAKDPYYITPLIMGASMFIQQKITPTTGDPLQSKIMLLMPIFFTFLFLNFPSGLVIYWLVNNVLSIGQQIYINKYTK